MSRITNDLYEAHAGGTEIAAKGPVEPCPLPLQAPFLDILQPQAPPATLLQVPGHQRSASTSQVRLLLGPGTCKEVLGVVHALYCNAAPWRLMGVMACHSTHAGKLTELWGLQLPAGGVLLPRLRCGFCSVLGHARRCWVWCMRCTAMQLLGA